MLEIVVKVYYVVLAVKLEKLGKVVMVLVLVVEEEGATLEAVEEEWPLVLWAVEEEVRTSAILYIMST